MFVVVVIIVVEAVCFSRHIFLFLVSFFLLFVVVRFRQRTKVKHLSNKDPPVEYTNYDS